MKRFIFLLLLSAFCISSNAQFADSTDLNKFIRDTIRDRRPERVTAEQLQKALLGSANLQRKRSDSLFANAKVPDSVLNKLNTAYSWGNHAGLYAPLSGSANYIQNQTAIAQTASFKINGTGVIYGGLSNQFKVGYSEASNISTTLGVTGEAEVKLNGGNASYNLLMPTPLADLVPTMTSNTTPTGIASTNSYASNNDAFNAYKAFDNNNSTYWASWQLTPAWIQYTFSTAKTVVTYKILPPTDAQIVPKNWIFQGSNDGSSWTTLDTRTNEVFIIGSFNIYTIANTNSYLHYRLNITATASGSATCGVGELELFEASSYSYNFTVNNAGNVGIGNNAPLYKLDVNGAMRIGNLTSAPTGANGIFWYDQTNHQYVGYRNGASKNLLMSGDAAPVSGSTNYIQAQTGNPDLFTAQSGVGFYIGGRGRIGALLVNASGPVGTEVARVEGVISVTNGRIDSYGSPLMGSNFAVGTTPRDGYGPAMYFEGGTASTVIVNHQYGGGSDPSAIVLKSNVNGTYLYLKPGVVKMPALATTGAAPATTGTTKYVITDQSGLQSFSSLNAPNFTPTSSADASGNVGDITRDDNYIYVKTSAGWKRSALTTF